jgi:lipoprotein-anchoring transpeptidase ErfK/SrfK
LIATLVLAGVPAFAEEKSARRIVVSIPDHKLALLDGDRVLRVFDVAVGKRTTPSPEGQFAVVTRVAHPTWYYAGKVVGPGKANPLGTRWLGLSVKGFGIHGTNVPSSIGKHASHGCIRMRNRDVEVLFELVAVGVRVELTGSPDEALRRSFTSAD